MYDLTTDNVFLDANGKSVLEVNGGGPTHFILPDGTETDHGGTADRQVIFDIRGFALDTYIDEVRLPDGSFAFTNIAYDNSGLPPFAQVLLQYLFFGGEPASVFRHSNTYQFIQQDGHGNRVEEHFVDGRLRDAQYDHADGSEVFTTFDENGTLTRYQAIHAGVGVSSWTPNTDGTWTENHSGNVVAGPVALQDIANDAATLWAVGTTIGADNGLLVLHDGGLVINDNFQYAISNNGSSLVGTDTASALIGHDGASLIGHDGASLISSDGAGLISLQANDLIGHDGASLIGHDGASLIGHDGASLITSDGAALVQEFSTAINPSGMTVGTRLVHALVFADTNFNGKFDAGEPWTVTDANGHYELRGGSGPLTVLEGVDAGTNLPFALSFEAPVGSSIISPLTTLTTELWKQIGSVQNSITAVDSAFGLGNADLVKLDPVAGLQSGDAASAKIYVAGAKVMDTMDIMAGALQGMGADVRDAGHAVVLAMVDDLKQTGKLDLNDKSTVAALFTSAAHSVGLDGSAIAASIAGIVTSKNAQLDAALAKDAVGTGLLTDLVSVEINVQGSLSDSLIAAGGDPNKIADIAPTGPDQTPTGSGTPHWTASIDLGGHPAGWSPGGIGDFTADGTSDLAWYNAASGDIDIWKLANGKWSASSDVGMHPAGYQPVGFGDYNHDGTSDVLWFNQTTRDVDIWELSNGKWSASVDVGAHPAGYTPAGTGDLNGDGTSDVVWYNAATRDVDLWELSNGKWSASVDIGVHPAGYQPSLIGDFNGDGTGDIAWFNATTGDLDIWKIANGKWAGSVDVGVHPAGYQPLAAADLNHDGTGDIVWYNPATNDVDVWLLKNGQWSASVDLGSHPAGSVPVGVGDFDHNGAIDIMWRDTNTGHVDNWMLALS